MKGRWIDALFNELGRPAPPPSLPVPSRDKNDQVDPGAGWRARRTSSPPKRSGAYDINADYDLARHARSSLQIDSGRDGSRDSVQRNPDARSSWLEPVRFPHAPTYSPERLSGTPNGPRPPLYAQERPPSPPRQSQPTDFIGGFITPERQYHAYDSGHDTCSSPSSSNRRDPFGPAPPIPPFRPSPSSLQSPSRLHPYSTPSRTHHIPTASADRPHSSPNVPLLQPGRTSNTTSPSKSPLHSPDMTNGAPVKANQCHGTTGAGKRCTRVVGKAAAGKKLPSSGSTSPAKSRDRDPPTLLTISALRQLDRRLSIGKQRQRQRGGTPRKAGRSRQTSNNVEDGDEEDYYESGMARYALPGSRETEDQDVYEELPVYCFQHAKQTLEQQGTFVGSLFVDFSDWIPQALPQETKLQLRHEISKPISSDDIPGYIYVHEMAGADTNYSPTTFIKLGRSVKPVARLSQWKSQCKSRQPIVRDIFPLHPSHPLHPQATASSLINGSPSRMHGALSFASQGTRNHHRWERFCLIELAGLAALQAAERNATEQARQKCSDCGKIHVELFLVNRGSYERDIRGIVLRWQRFVETIG